MIANRKHIIGIISTILIAVILVSTLAWVALKPINQDNGFSRKIVTQPVQLAKIEKDEKIRSIAGSTEHHIYFRTMQPGVLYVMDYNLQNSNIISIPQPKNLGIAPIFQCIVDSPFVDVLLGNTPAVQTMDINSGKVSEYNFPNAPFTRVAKISPVTYIFRAIDQNSRTLRQVFIKGNPVTNKLQVGSGVDLIEKDLGGIASDGIMNYDKKTSSLTYVSFYSNRFYCIDTNLNLLYKGHTVDTMSTVQVEAESVGGVVTNSTPTRVVNSRSFVHNGYLLNISKLKADNETLGEFATNITIDVYEIKNGEYKFSFRLPTNRGEKILDLKVIGDRLIVLYATHIIEFELPKELKS